MPTENQDHTVDPTQALIAEIAEIVPLMERLGCMPERLRRRHAGVRHLEYNYALIGRIFVSMPDRDAHHILTREAEEYLRGKGWYHLSRADDTHIYNCKSGTEAACKGKRVIAGISFGHPSLASALAAQCEREGK